MRCLGGSYCRSAAIWSACMDPCSMKWSHGHPSRSAWLDEALVFPSLWLWLPFRIYREMHLLHHRDQQLTWSGERPRKKLPLPGENLAAMGPAAQLFWRALGTVTGRMVCWPSFFGGRFWWRELSRHI